MTSNRKTRALAALEAHRVALGERSIASLFADDPKRFDTHHVRLDDLLFDYSKHRVDDIALAHLIGELNDLGRSGFEMQPVLRRHYGFVFRLEGDTAKAICITCR